MEIIKRPYRSLVDFEKVYQFLLDNYTVDWRNGVPATYFEYSQISRWTDNLNSHRNAIWEEHGRIVAFCFYEAKIGEAFFNIGDAYERLIPEMLDHSEQSLSTENGDLALKIYNQPGVIREAEKRGYQKIHEWTEGIYDFAKGPLSFTLPEGFAFETPGQYDMGKKIEAIWRGFDHDSKPEGGAEDGYHSAASPHSTHELDVIVKNPKGEYVCCAGMWLVPENKLAYMEPLSTLPAYRRMGLASAVLSECYRRTAAKGATHMTGGANPFYFAIGYDPFIKVSIWKKKK